MDIHRPITPTMSSDPSDLSGASLDAEVADDLEPMAAHLEAESP